MARSSQVRTSGIGTKLSLAFAILVGLTLLVVALTFVAGREATRDIGVTEEVRAPASLASARAQDALLRMQLHLRGYLVLSDRQDVDQYGVARDAFESALASLQALAPRWEQDEQRRLSALADKYAQWKQLPPKLFALHEDPLLNRPALRLSRVDVQQRRVQVLSDTEAMIDVQKKRPANDVNRDTLTAILAFQTSFDALATNIMAYGASGDSTFKLNYSPQLITNAASWNALTARRPWLTPQQREQLDHVAVARLETTELALQIRAILDGDRAFEDLFLYRTEVVPQASALIDLLQDITRIQQAHLQRDLSRARRSLEGSRIQAVVGGLVALAPGVIMAFLLRRSIVRPVRQLTAVATQIADGDLKARAAARSGDEIGTLASTLNTMTQI